VTEENNFDATEIMVETLGKDIAENPTIKEEVTKTLKLLHEQGAKKTLQMIF